MINGAYRERPDHVFSESQLAAHDRQVANAAAKKALLDAADNMSIRIKAPWTDGEHARLELLIEFEKWLRARSESYGGQK